MEIDTGIVVVAAVMVLFYLRLAMLRGRKRRLKREEQLAAMKGGKKVKIQPVDPNMPPFQVVSWWLVGLAVILILGGMISRSATSFPELLQQYWWVVTSIGVLVFAFSFK